jgi:hypothetical protein
MMDRYFNILVLNGVFVLGVSIGLVFAPHFGGEVTIYKQDRLPVACQEGVQ